jgi:hypothetical protein
MGNLIVIGRAAKAKIIEDVPNSEVIRKAKICATCEHAVRSRVFSVIPEKDIIEIQGKRCNICGCSISLKIRSSDKCPKNKWQYGK